jgi:hypothetical protein
MSEEDGVMSEEKKLYDAMKKAFDESGAYSEEYMEAQRKYNEHILKEFKFEPPPVKKTTTQYEEVYTESLFSAYYTSNKLDFAKVMENAPSFSNYSDCFSAYDGGAFGGIGTSLDELNEDHESIFELAQQMEMMALAEKATFKKE